ncbi:aminotransferase class IV [Silanimonas lenta]|uniref:aminotransferase class IV n=1 Tax=Silanimonas lenta TaxID=265429 RepID=UPI00040C39FD|nr:aminotransferase class IV [Silanimonas lenta]
MSLMQWCDGRIAGAESFSTPLTSHALHYGTGVFEGIRSYGTDDGGAAVFRLPEHLERMRRGADALGMRFDVAQAAEAVLATLRANGHRDAYIRPLLWFDAGGLGLDVDRLSERLMVATLPWSSHLGTHRVRLTVSPFRRNPAKALPPLKLCGNYVNSILAKREASQRGFGEALFVDDHGFVVECTGENVFLVKDGRITAVEHGDALPGITRDTVIRLTGAASRPVRIEELLAADEVFLTGTSAEIARVEAIDGRVFPASPVGDALAARYADVVRGRCDTAHGWLTRV